MAARKVIPLPALPKELRDDPELRALLERKNFFILEGKKPVPATLLEWGFWLEQNRAARIVARTELPQGILVSTVFLGLDHSFGNGPALLFETMAFLPPQRKKLLGRWHEVREEIDQQRYSTYEQAEAGHERIVRAIREKVLPLLKDRK